MCRRFCIALGFIIALVLSRIRHGYHCGRLDSAHAPSVVGLHAVRPSSVLFWDQHFLSLVLLLCASTSIESRDAIVCAYLMSVCGYGFWHGLIFVAGVLSALCRIV